MSYHYTFGSIPGRVAAVPGRVTAQAGRTSGQVVAQAGRTGSQIKSAASTVKRGAFKVATTLVERSAPVRMMRAAKSVEDAVKSAEVAAKAAGDKVDNAVELIKESKKKLEAAKVFLEKNQLTRAHWNTIDQLEAKFNKTLNMLPLTSRLPLIAHYSKLLDYAAIGAAMALIGSTGLLWFFFGREKKPETKHRSRPPADEYIEIAEGEELPEGYEIVEG